MSNAFPIGATQGGDESEEQSGGVLREQREGDQSETLIRK